MKRNAVIREAFGFDDILLVPSETNVKPDEITTQTRLTKSVNLGIPLIAAGVDNVTESAMAIAIAQLGGIGIIHDNMPMGKQVEEVRKVKRAEGETVTNPITIAPESSIQEAVDLMTRYKISALPVISQPSQKVVGILTTRDIRFFEDHAKPVSELMTKDVITVKDNIEKDMAKKLLHQHRIEKLVVIDDQGKCTGLITLRDIEQLSRYPYATRDKNGCLRVGAAVTTGREAFERTAAMADAGLDVVFIDVAQAHTRDAIGTVSRIRQQRTANVQIVAGHVATPEAAQSLIDAGADAIMVGIGSSEHSASRHIAGVGMPSMTGLLSVVEQCAMQNVPIIAGNGINKPGDIAKAIGAGAESVVIDTLFTGTDEAPGNIIYFEGRPYKVLNPTAKAQHRAATATNASDPYKLDEDAPDTSVPYRGGLVHMVEHLISSLKSAMAYTGSKDVQAMIENAQFVRTK